MSQKTFVPIVITAAVSAALTFAVKLTKNFKKFSF